jgi:nucleotide-binding universal stress UspA family protein
MVTAMPDTLTAVKPSPSTTARSRTGPLVVAAGGDELLHILRAARTLAPAFGGRVHLLSVLEPLPVAVLESEPILVPPSFEEERHAERVQSLEALLREVAGPDSGWQLEVVHGDPASTVTDRARALEAGLLLRGIGRHRPIDRLLASETTLRIIRRASCPVLAVAGELATLPRNIVVATDFGAESALAARAALALAAPRAALHLVHVWEPANSANASLLALEQRYLSGLGARLARFREVLDVPADFAVTDHVLEGKTVPQILAFAEAQGADLIVAGRHGLGRLARLFVGSVTTSLLRGASCAVLVTPEPGFAELDAIQRRLTGTSETTAHEDWPRQLAEFAERNRGRRTVLEVDDPEIGAQTQETGYALVGATYDPRDARVELMLGSPEGGTPHLTRGITHVDAVAVSSGADGKDLGLRIKHGDGQTILTFTPTA